MFRILTAILLALATTTYAQSGLTTEDSTPGWSFTNPFSFHLRMPEDKPHKVEAPDFSELQETRYTQKDEQPTSPTAPIPPAGGVTPNPAAF